jgi:hypothetical protein
VAFIAECFGHDEDQAEGEGEVVDARPAKLVGGLHFVRAWRRVSIMHRLKGGVMKWAVILLAMLTIGAAPSSKLSEEDRQKLVDAAVVKLQDATDHFKAIEAAAHERSHWAASCKAAIGQLAADEAAAERAEASGTREDKSRAAADVERAKVSIEFAENRFVQTDPAVIAADRQCKIAADELDALRWRDLLDAVEPGRDAILGEWAFAKNALVANSRNPVDRATLHVPVDFPNSYELSITFHRTGEMGGPFIMLPVNNTFAVLEIDRGDADGGRCSGLSNIGGADAMRNASHLRGLKTQPGLTYALRIYVSMNKTNVSIATFLNDELFVNWSGTLDQISREEYFKFPDGQRLGLAAWRNRVTFDSVKMMPLLSVEDAQQRIAGRR